MNKISLYVSAMIFQFFSSASVAELKSVGPGGFSVHHALATSADREMVYRAMIDDISKWWEGDHSWSGDAANLYFDARLDGCFCERLPGGGVEHLRIIYIIPGSEIRMRGALGPLQQMGLHGAMTWKLESTESGTSITFEYIVNGYLADGFEGIAPAVDGVIGAQLQGLVNFLGSE